MKKVTIKMNKELIGIKETPEQRKERIRVWPTTRTQIIPNKKAYDRKKLSKVEC